MDNLSTFTLILACATVLLAFFTWLSIYKADQRDKRRKEEESKTRIEERERDYKVRLVSDLLNWCIQSFDWFFDVKVDKFGDLGILLKNLNVLLENIKNIAVVLSSSEDDELLKLVKKLDGVIVVFQDTQKYFGSVVDDFENSDHSSEYIKDEIKNPLKENIVLLKNSMSELRTSILQYRIKLLL